MKLTKMSSLAILAAITTMALASPGSASADVLCLSGLTANGECTGVGHTNIAIKATGSSTFLTTVGTTTCVTDIQASIERSFGSHGGILGKINNLAFTSECSGICKTAKTQNLPWHALGSGLNQHIVVSSGGSGNPTFLFEDCTFFNVNCQYSTPWVLLNFSGGFPAKLTVSKVSMSRSGHSGFCSPEATWGGSFSITSPLSLLHLASLP
jgi:hypothetical protein